MKDDSLPIGKVLRMIRTQRNLTQVKLAELSGIDFRTIEAIEKGRIRNPSFPKLKKLCEALGLTLRNFFGILEGESARHLVTGTPRGEFTLEYPKNRFRIISYIPQHAHFFVGKLILESKGQVDSQSIPFPGMVFCQVILGKLDLLLEGKESLLKEGNTAFFDARLNFRIGNPQMKDATAFLIANPSFL